MVKTEGITKTELSKMLNVNYINFDKTKVGYNNIDHECVYFNIDIDKVMAGKRNLSKITFYKVLSIITQNIMYDNRKDIDTLDIDDIDFNEFYSVYDLTMSAEGIKKDFPQCPDGWFYDMDRFISAFAYCNKDEMLYDMEYINQMLYMQWIEEKYG